MDGKNLNREKKLLTKKMDIIELKILILKLRIYWTVLKPNKNGQKP